MAIIRNIIIELPENAEPTILPVRISDDIVTIIILLVMKPRFLMKILDNQGRKSHSIIFTLPTFEAIWE